MTHLVIVESPAKAKTIAQYLGPGYQVRASMGHVRDLPKGELGVDVEHGFRPSYEPLPDKRATLRDLRSRAKTAETVILATDPDREGEAIAWHLAEALNLPTAVVRRVEFHSLTRAAVGAAMQSPRAIDQRLVDAQQARRILDRLVGYRISPLLWRKVKRGLSAGRVQSVAVRLIVDREREIVAFETREYWTITGRFERTSGAARQRRPFDARLHRVGGKPAEITDEAAAATLVDALRPADYAVATAETKRQQRRASPPFTTSSMQQEAARKLGMSAKTTMSAAQKLYEGIDIGGSTEGLITYMRTDSLTIAPEARAAARAFIRARWGDAGVPAQPNIYRARTKGAQEAHEAIRPTDPSRDPESLRSRLSAPHFRLYRLIWQRFIASQMSPAVFDMTTVDIAARLASATHADRPAAIFRATGSVIIYPGFLQVYREGLDDGDDELDEKTLPPLAPDDAVRLLGLTPEQHFTQPPPRFTEASLIKRLEEAGIGRPSTYASIITTILERDYVERREKQLAPTELGAAVTDLLVKHFQDILDPGFTAAMEERLDDVAAGERAWTPVLEEFYRTFLPALEAAIGQMERVHLPEPETGERCPVCNEPLVLRKGKFGQFIACRGYPACDYSKPLVIGTGVTCPTCGDGELVQRASKKTGKAFWSCNRYPTCAHAEWYLPLTTPCGRCGSHLSQIARGRTRCIACDGQPPRDGRGKSRTNATSPSTPSATVPARRRSPASQTKAAPLKAKRTPPGQAVAEAASPTPAITAVRRPRSKGASPKTTTVS